MLIIGGSGSGKTNTLLTLMKERDSENFIGKMYFYAKLQLNEPKYQFIIIKREEAGIKHLNDRKKFIEYSGYMDDVHNNSYSLTRKMITA